MTRAASSIFQRAASEPEMDLRDHSQTRSHLSLRCAGAFNLVIVHNYSLSDCITSPDRLVMRTHSPSRRRYMKYPMRQELCFPARSNRSQTRRDNRCLCTVRPKLVLWLRRIAFDRRAARERTCRSCSGVRLKLRF